MLVATDFSDFSAAALDYALSIAEVHHANVHVVHVVDEHAVKHLQLPDYKMSNSVDDAVIEARSQMKKFVLDNIDEFTCVEEVILCGAPHEEIARFAKDYHCDLIVIATHGRTGLAHVLVGSIAEKVVRSSTVPVLTIKPTPVLEKLITDEDVVQSLHIDNLK
jgi:nucleotide-binding universal stress UspA family protein